MNAPSVIDQFLAHAEARAAAAIPTPFNHHQEQSMSVSDPSQTQTTTSTPATATEAPRPSLRDSLRFDTKDTKKTAVAATGSGVDVDRPRPPALKTEAGELAPPEPGILTSLIEAFRNLILRLFHGLFGPSSVPRGTMVTSESGEPAQDARDALIQQLKEDLAEARNDLARLRAAASAAGLDLDHVDRAEDATVKGFEAAERALALDKRRDVARARREATELPGEDHLRRLRSSSYAVVAVAPEDKPQALQAMNKAREEAATWSRGAAVAARLASHDHAETLTLQRQAIAEANTMADAAADAAAASDGQAVADVEAADEEAAAGPDRAPSPLDQLNPAQAAALRAKWIEINRRIRRLHVHVVDLPKPTQEELQALPTPAARLAALRDHEEALRLARAERDEELIELGEHRRALARELWPSDDLDDEADEQQERPR